MLGSLAQNEEREEYMDFIGPYMQVGEVFYVNTARTDLQAQDDLTGKRVAVVQNYAAATWLAENRPDLQLVPVPDMLSGLEAVSTGTVDAFFENVPVAGYYIRERSISNVKILGDPLYYSPANWGLEKDNQILYSIISKGLASIPPGEQTAIFEYWSGYDLGIAPVAEPGPLFSPLALAILAGLGITVVAGGAWALTLRGMVRSRTEDLRHSNERIQKANDDLALRVEARSNELRALTEQEGRIYEALEKQATGATRLIDRAAWELQNRYHGIIKPPTQQAVQRARSASWEVQEMLAALTDTARSEPVPRGRPVPLAPALHAAAQLYEHQHRNGIDLDCPADVSMPLPGAEMQRLGARLVGFAAQISGDAPVLHVAAEPDGWIRVRLPNAVLVPDVDQLLEPLAKPTSGLSLPAVARVVHRAGGDLRLESGPEGLTISLLFDATTAPGEARESENGRRAPRPQLKRPRRSGETSKVPATTRAKPGTND